MPFPWIRHSAKSKSIPTNEKKSSEASEVSSPAATDKQSSKAKSSKNSPDSSGTNNGPTTKDSTEGESSLQRVFYCQLAHGSPTGVVSGFSNISELYASIAKCYEIDPSEILFCTLNNPKVDMEYLLSGQLGIHDFIFAHVKGQRKEVEMTKMEVSLGLTITDNGAGYAFVKRIKLDSAMDRLGSTLLDIGDHIESINGVCFVGHRHYDVVRALKAIPVGETFTMRLIAPESTPFTNLSVRSLSGTSGRKGIDAVGSGKTTIRFKAGQKVKEEESLNYEGELAVQLINSALEDVLGVDDKELALCIYEVGKSKINVDDFQAALNLEMGEFAFSEVTVQEFWRAMRPMTTVTQEKKSGDTAGMMTSIQELQEEEVVTSAL